VYIVASDAKNELLIAALSIALYCLVHLKYSLRNNRDFPLIESDDEKLDGIFRKLATLQLDSGEPVAAATTLKELVSRLKDPRKVTEAWRSIVQILSGVKQLPKEDTPLVCFTLKLLYFEVIDML